MIRAMIMIGIAVTASASASADRKPTDQDVRRYAVATCLTFQKSDRDYLKHQGEYANSILLEQLGNVVFDWAPVGKAVQLELAAQPPFAVHVDAPVAQSTQSAPIAQCLFITDTPRVRRAVIEAESGLLRRKR